MNLYILKYNNYYNRIVKFESSLTNYLQYQVGTTIEGVSFNPNDGVNTTQIVNKGYESLGNYLLAVDDSNEINSRWFIMEAKRLRTGQYQLTLRRDLIVDNYTEIINAPCFIEKATVSNNDPAIFNNENMTFNQIKTSETPLKDSTFSAWIVGYLATGTAIPETEVSYEIGQPYADVSTFKAYWETLKNTSLIDDSTIFNGIVTGYSDFEISLYYTGTNNYYNRSLVTRTTIKHSKNQILTNFPVRTRYSNDAEASDEFGNEIHNQVVSIDENIVNGYGITTSSPILSYNGKILFNQADGKYYTCNITTKRKQYVGATKLTPNLQQIVKTAVANCNSLSGTPTFPYNYEEGTPIGTTDSANITLTNVSYLTYNLVEIVSKKVKYSVPSSAQQLQDAPYIMFAIPYNACKLAYLDGTTEKRISLAEEDAKSYALAIATDISRTQGGTNPKLYDIQLLPYCPMQDNIQMDGTVLLKTSNTYSFIKDDSGNIVSLMLFSPTSRGTFNIQYSINILDYKISNETQLYKLVSPNYNGEFAFSAAKNGGVSTINVDFEYKPFQPYIHLNPNFGRLYGTDFNDARGLICGGDFSMTQTSDAWQTYQREYINYDKIFSRETRHIEFNNKIQNAQTTAQITAGTVQGAATGGILGGVIGAAVGATTSAAAGAADLALQQMGQQEALNYRADMYGYNLGNIQARPNTLTKVSAFNNNNKIFPFLEIYECTDEEREALRNKIKYNGMTVMRIGTIAEFIRNEKSYIKGQLIRLEDINEDYHYINEISQEIYKGVFI